MSLDSEPDRLHPGDTLLVSLAPGDFHCFFGEWSEGGCIVGKGGEERVPGELGKSQKHPTGIQPSWD